MARVRVLRGRDPNLERQLRIAALVLVAVALLVVGR